MNPVVQSKTDIDANDHLEVTVIGTYRQIDIRRKKIPPAEFRGHVAIELSDGHLVILEPSWSDDSLRPQQERRKFDNKNVAITGYLYADAPPPPEPFAVLKMPCLSPVQKIEFKDEF